VIVARRGAPALTALALILAITAAWWALALWPLNAAAPAWLARTRLVCFGASLDGLPDAAGWVVLVGQPLGMLLLLLVVWGNDVRAGMRLLLERTSGQITVGVTLAAILIGAAGVAVRVRDANAQPFTADPTESLSRRLTRINDAPPALGLVDQTGRSVTLEQFRGRPVLVTFAFGHCETVCPLVVHAALFARDQLTKETPVVIIVTLDPWRDTPSRLAAIAEQWGVTGDGYVLSGAPSQVDLVLNAWRIPRVRNEKTGDLSHPSVVYVISRAGRITYVVGGSAEQIIAAVRAL
jgi:protein SCO1